MAFWYLSFAGEEGWRGCIHMEAPTGLLALTKANLLGLNPGGEVVMIDITHAAESKHPNAQIIRDHLDQLLTRADMDRLFNDMVRIPFDE